MEEKKKKKKLAKDVSSLNLYLLISHFKYIAFFNQFQWFLWQIHLEIPFIYNLRIPNITPAFFPFYWKKTIFDFFKS